MSQAGMRVINSVAPIRVCDNGGWTDTWFARYGKVFNIAVNPYVEVQVQVRVGGEGKGERGKTKDESEGVTIFAENYGERYVWQGRGGKGAGGHRYGKHPLLEAAIECMGVPTDGGIEVAIYSAAPVGCSTGTSAAVSVALLGALDRLQGGRMAPHAVAELAQRIETEMLGQQCGVQDQLASAYGGINVIEIDAYPHAFVHPVPLGDALWWELESRLALVYVGSGHNSSDVHRKVIAELEGAGPEAPKLQPLRRTAEAARAALLQGDWTGLGRVMSENTEAQGELHADLIGPGHRKVIEVAREFGALGWKVNGAGGEGGSVTILGEGSWARRRAMLTAMEKAGLVVIPITLSREGLRVWEG